LISVCNPSKGSVAQGPGEDHPRGTSESPALPFFVIFAISVADQLPFSKMKGQISQKQKNQDRD
jgi:hypothetical protein